MMIETVHLTKTFAGSKGEVNALRDVNLRIGAGAIYGIIGMSGAGKSTLVRCLNFLERPTSGEVVVDGKKLSTLTDAELRKERTEVSMIFQDFNLLMQRTVLDNVCFPMEITGVKKQEARERAANLLQEVGLGEKAQAYPAQLSGGQQQRVAIARALANNPKILLCDEATSALDPKTTKSILSLLKEINETRGITIVIITHAMSVVEEICTHVAIIDEGVVAEAGTVEEVFTRPRSQAARRLVLPEQAGSVEEMKSRRCIRIVYSENSSFEPVIGNMVLAFKTPVNILLADTRDVNGTAKGQMILQLPDDPETADKMIRYLEERNLAVEELEHYMEDTQ